MSKIVRRSHFDQFLRFRNNHLQLRVRPGVFWNDCVSTNTVIDDVIDVFSDHRSKSRSIGISVCSVSHGQHIGSCAKMADTLWGLISSTIGNFLGFDRPRKILVYSIDGEFLEQWLRGTLLIFTSIFARKSLVLKRTHLVTPYVVIVLGYCTFIQIWATNYRLNSQYFIRWA